MIFLFNIFHGHNLKVIPLFNRTGVSARLAWLLSGLEHHGSYKLQTAVIIEVLNNVKRFYKVKKSGTWLDLCASIFICCDMGKTIPKF